MSNLDNLLSKIEADSKAKAGGVIEEAEREAAQVIAEASAQAEKERDGIVTTAKAEAARLKEQLITQSRIAIRDSGIKARQEVFESVLHAAAARLKELPTEEYGRFLTEYLSLMNLTGDEDLILPEKYHDIDLSNIGGSAVALTKYQGGRSIESGFAVIKGGMEYNNTFEALFDYYRDDLEKIISETLF